MMYTYIETYYMRQCSQIVDGIFPFHSTILLKERKLIKYNLEKFLNFIILLSCSLIILKYFHKLYSKNWVKSWVFFRKTETCTRREITGDVPSKETSVWQLWLFK